MKFFFLLMVFFHRHWRIKGQKGKGGDHLSFTLPLPPAHEHWEIYLQLCMWDGYHISLIVTLAFTRLLLDEIYHLIQLLFDWLIDWLIDDEIFVFLLDKMIRGFCYSNLTWKTSGFELASIITLVLQANRLTKCAVC